MRNGSITVRRDAFEGDPILDAEMLDIGHVLNNVDMEEVGSKDPYKTLFTMFCKINVAGYEVSHIFANDMQVMRRWLGLPEMVSLGGRIFGIRVHKDDSIPEDVLLVCGSPQRTSQVGLIQYVVKVSMIEEVEHEAALSEDS